MTTTKHELTDEAWVDLGPCPCLVQSVTGLLADRTRHLATPAMIAVVISDTAPTDLDAAAHAVDGHVISIGDMGRVWARAENGFGALVVVSR